MNLNIAACCFFGVVAVSYLALICLLMLGYERTKSIRKVGQSQIGSVSIIVPFFNEEANIQTCLNSLLNQQCTNIDYEILAVNDFSTDNSATLVKNLQVENHRVRLIESLAKGKKNALQTAIALAKSPLIITVDADCIYPPHWLQTMVDTYQQTNAKMLIGPVKISPVNRMFRKFQFVDMMSLVGSGAGAAGLNHPIMCNGANLAFEREAFLSFNDPFNAKYLSGDDVFLLHKMKQAFPGEIFFVNHPDVMVETKPVDSWSGFFHQRSRWAYKAGGYTDFDSLLVAGLIAFTSFSISIGLVISILIHGFIFPVLATFLIKTLADGLFLYRLSHLFGNRKSLYLLPFFEILFIGYVTAIVALFPFKRTTQNW